MLTSLLSKQVLIKKTDLWIVCKMYLTDNIIGLLFYDQSEFNVKYNIE